MLDSFFERAPSRRRLAAHADRPTLETLCRHLRRRGYRADVIRGYVRSAEHFANWLRRERKRTLGLSQPARCHYRLVVRPADRDFLPVFQFQRGATIAAFGLNNC